MDTQKLLLIVNFLVLLRIYRHRSHNIFQCVSPHLIFVILSSVIRNWPFNLTTPVIHNIALSGPNLSPSHFLLASNDESSLIKLCRFDKNTFAQLHTAFYPFWIQSKEKPAQTLGHLQIRKLTSEMNLLMVLHYLAHGVSVSSLCLFIGCVASTTSRYLIFGLYCLRAALKSIAIATLSQPSDEYAKSIGMRCGDMFGDAMRGCAYIVDGSLHALEMDEAANANFFYDINHPDYNGWRTKYCKKGLYLFCLDGCIAWYLIDCPGRWHDARMFDSARDFIDSMAVGIWILGDSAFRRIPGRVERVRKKGENLPSNLTQRNFQLRLEKVCSKIRISAEWGVNGLKNTFKAWKLPLPSDDPKMRKIRWFVTMSLYNFRNRTMNINQIRNSLMISFDSDYEPH